MSILVSSICVVNCTRRKASDLYGRCVMCVLLLCFQLLLNPGVQGPSAQLSNMTGPEHNCKELHYNSAFEEEVISIVFILERCKIQYLALPANPTANFAA